MNMNRVKIGIIILLFFTVIASGQRTDIEETKTTHSEMLEYTTIFYNNTGNDSIYYFDSDTYNTHILTLNGDTGNITINKGNLTVPRNIIATAFYGDGGNLTNLPAGFTYSDWFNQLLNTTNSPTFNDITLTLFPNLDKDSTDDFSGNYNDLTNKPTNFSEDDVTLFDVQSACSNDFHTIGGIDANTISDPWFNSSAAYYITSVLMGQWNDSYSWGNHAGLYALANHWHNNSYFLKTILQPWMTNWNTSHGWGNHAVFNYLTSCGLVPWGNLTGIPSGFADNIDNDTIDTNWNNLTNIPAGFADGIDNEGESNPFNQDLNTTDSPTFDDITLTSYPNLDKDSTDDITVEADPWFNSSIAKTLQQSWLNNWNTSFGWGTHTGLYSLLGHIHDFNYSGYNQDLNTSSLVEFENVTIDDTLDFTNGGTTWNIYVNATGVLVWEIK